jgi:hypothetical protein
MGLQNGADNWPWDADSVESEIFSISTWPTDSETAHRVACMPCWPLRRVMLHVCEPLINSVFVVSKHR